MRWIGHGKGLPLPIKTAEAAVEPSRTPEQATIPIEAPAIDKESEYQRSFNQGFELRMFGKADEALAVYLKLLVSDAMPEIKARAALELKEIEGANKNLPAEVLVAILRYSPDPEQRRMAQAKLEDLGLVERMKEG